MSARELKDSTMSSDASVLGSSTQPREASLWGLKEGLLKGKWSAFKESVRVEPQEAWGGVGRNSCQGVTQECQRDKAACQKDILELIFQRVQDNLAMWTR